VRGRFLDFGGEKLTHGKSDAISGPLSGGALTWSSFYTFGNALFTIVLDCISFE
jgi:hypothetical protein